METRKMKLALSAGALALSLALAGCGGGSGPVAEDPPPPTPYEMAQVAIDAADTAADAQAAVDNAAPDVSGAELRQLQKAADDRKQELATMASADAQKAALGTAAGMIDTSDLSDAEAIAAANAAIAGLEAALTGATDVSDADKAMYQGQVTAAKTAVMTAQSALDHAAQTMALTGAVTALQAIDLSGLSDQANIDAAESAITALQTALDNADELSNAEKAAAMTLLATANRTVMAAQGRVDTGSQTSMLSSAHDALGMIDLDDLMTQEQIDDAKAAIMEVDTALDEATNLTDAQKLDALTDVTVAKRKVEAAETVLAENVGEQRMTLTEAGTALGEIDLTDLSDQANIDAANAAIEALKMALEGATHLSDDETATYQSQLEMATDTVRTAQTGMVHDERVAMQRTAIMKAVEMATTAVAGVRDTSTDSEVAAADTAIQKVRDEIDNADDLSKDDAEIISAEAALKIIEPILANAKTSRMAAMEKADEEQSKDNAALGKAMHMALGGPTPTATALGNLASVPSLTAAGLAITSVDNAGSLTGGANNPADNVTLKAGASAGSLGSWNGMDYAHTNAGTKVMNEARVYTNQGPATTQPFSNTETDGKYPVIAANNPMSGYLPLVNAGSPVDSTDRPLSRASAPEFNHSGTRSHDKGTNNIALTFRGEYDGAPGMFHCTETCTSTNDNKGGPSALGGTWHFKPDTGAMVSKPDSTYLYYGWWVSKDKDGAPTAASAFSGVFGDGASIQGGQNSLATDPSTLGGSATYAGHAAGKFAMSDALNGTGSGGHFTADVMLTAKFEPNAAPNNGGVSGMIDNFMANDESVPWSVALHRAPWGADGAFVSTADATDKIANGTTWSINGNSAPESGTWKGQMYDEMLGTVSDGGDGSDVPTTATGTFYSEFTSVGRMVGAFGAEKQ